MIATSKARLRLAHEAATAFPIRFEAWIRFQLRRHRYRFLDEAALRAARRSDTLFIFGSGYSINDLTELECRHFEQHDTLSFNWFVHQDLLRIDYHFVREVTDTDRVRSIWRPQIQRYFDLIGASRHYAGTTFLVQTGFRAINGNRAIGLSLLPPDRPIFLWRSVRDRDAFGRSFAEGLSHPHATLEECVNFAILLGWKDIVLVGVDLYDRRYFWLAPDETRSNDRARGATFADAHNRAGTGMVDTLGRWAREIAREGRTIWAYNPRSLLTEQLPVYPGTRATTV